MGTRKPHWLIVMAANNDLSDYFSKFSEEDGEWLRDWVWLTFMYDKEGNIRVSTVIM